MTRAVLLGLVGLVGCGDNLRPPPDAPGGAGPAVHIDSAPPAATKETHLSVAFHATGAASFTCELDTGGPTTCTSPWAFDATEGVHHVTVIASNAAGVTGAPATAQFTVDTTAPDTSITSMPMAVDSSKIAMFTFAAVPADPAATFECQVDGAGFTPCASPLTLTRFDGDHTFDVRAVDAAGNADASPAHAMWTISTSGPPIAITTKPAAISSLTTPMFAFSSTDGTATFECAVDADAFATCTSPFTTGTLAEGSHTFQVRATSGTTHLQSTGMYTWMVDTTPPTVTIASGPSDPTPDTTPTFVFTTSADTAHVTCAVAGGEVIDPCTSPATFQALAVGPHTVTITATDGATPANTGTATSTFTITTCGNGALDGTEVCDGADLDGKTCSDVTPFTAGTLACSSSCTLDTSGCSNFQAVPGTLTGALPADTSVCTFGGLIFGLGGTWVGVCTENHGMWRLNLTALGNPLPAASLFFDEANNPLSLTNSVNNPNGRSTQLQPNGAVVFVADSSTPAGAPVNVFRGGGGGLNNLNPNWARGTMTLAGAAVDVFGAVQGTGPTGNMIVGYASTQGATVWNGTLTAAGVPHAIGPGITGTATSLATRHSADSSGFPAAGTGTDIYVSVYPKAPDANGKLTIAAAGGGIYWTCNRTVTGQADFVERDTGLGTGAGSSPDDKDRVWTLTVDPSSGNVATPIPCVIPGNATTFASVSGTKVYYAALRGGGMVYRTADGGASWQPFNTGLPADLDVYQIVVQSGDHTKIFAATSAGVFRRTSNPAGTDTPWAPVGLAGRDVRSVTVSSDGTKIFGAVTAPDGDPKLYQTGIAP